MNLNPDTAVELAAWLGRACEACAALAAGLSETADDIGTSLRTAESTAGSATGAASAWFGTGDPMAALRRAARGADDLHRLFREGRDGVIRDYLGHRSEHRPEPGHRPGPGFYPPPMPYPPIRPFPATPGTAGTPGPRTATG